MVTIFLDIDGVLATFNDSIRDTYKFQKENEWAKNIQVPYPFDKKCVEIFNEILSLNECEIVLSSDWRKFWPLNELDIIFKENKVIQSPINITKIEHYFSSSGDKVRAAEIESYISKYKIEKWIILDDLYVGNYVPKNLKDRVFLINEIKGLGEEGLKEKIIDRLKMFNE